MSTIKRMMKMWVAVGVVVAGAGSVYGMDFNWSNASGGNWSDTNNWLGGSVANGAANAAVFPVSSGAIITIDQSSDVGTLKFPAGSLFTLAAGGGTLSNSAVEVGQADQSVSITAPVASPSNFYKTGSGVVEIPALSVSGSDIVVVNGSLKAMEFPSSSNYLKLGDGSTPVGGTVEFLLTTAGHWVENGVDFQGYGNNFQRVAGGANTNGSVYLNWIHAGYVAADNGLYFKAAAGGVVGIKNVEGNCPSSLIKIGSGTVRISEVGKSDANRSYSGGTIVRSGTLTLGADDYGTTTNGFVLPNGRPSNGAGGSLGYSDFAQPVELGDNRFEVRGSGYDLGWDNDAFHCVAGSLTNNGQIVARLMSLENTDDWAKAGVMMRETLDANAKSAMMLVTHTNGVQFLRRTEIGGMTTNVPSSGSVPLWVKLARNGNLITGAVSSDGATWTEVGSGTVSMNSVIQVGLVVCSHKTDALCKAVFQNVAGLPVSWVSQDVGAGLAGSAVFTGTLGTNDVGLLAGADTWIGHLLQVNPLGQSVTIGAADAGSCTFAGPVVLNRDVILTAPAGGDVTFNNAISGQGSIVITGAGTVKFAGTNTYSGTTAVNQGQLRIESSALLQSDVAMVVAADANAILSETMTGTSSLTKDGPGVLTVAAPQSYSGPTVVSGGTLRLGVPGLSEGRLNSQFDITDPNPNTATVLTTRYANSIDLGPWIDNSTYVYSGLINNSAAVPVTYTFAEKFDDGVMLRIDGGTILSNKIWDDQSSGTISLSPGWHVFDLRVSQGIGGVGPANGGVGGSGLGVAYSNAASAGWRALTENNATFLEADSPMVSFLSPSTTVSIASGAMLDLNRSTQTVAGVSGTGIVTNGLLTVTGTISPAGTNTIGTLAIRGDLTLTPNVVQNWDCSNSSADTVAVSGTLSLPAVATLNLNGLSGVNWGQRIVLYTFDKYAGAHDLSGWTISRQAYAKVDEVNKQVVLIAPGVLLIVN